MKLPRIIRRVLPDRSLIIIFMLATASMCLPGCSPPPHSAPDVHIFEGIDDSVGMEPHLGQETSLLVALSSRLDPGSNLTLFRVNFITNEFFNDPPPRSSGELRDLVVHTFRTRPARDGTRPLFFFREVARRAVQEPKPTVILFLSDGDQDFSAPQEEAGLQAAGRSLAANPHIKDVILCGMSPENWAAWRRRFSGLDATGRLHPAPLDQAALNKISAYITAAGHRSSSTNAPDH